MAANYAQKVAILAIAASAVAVVFALLIIPYLTTTALQPEQEYRRIVTLDTKYDFKFRQMVTSVDYIRPGDMDPNSFRWFLDPFGKTMEGSSTIGIMPKPGMRLNQSDWSISDDIEAFELYSIIRLPDYAGGSRDDLQSYRAYNAISISDHCISKYWPQEGRMHMENPCAGDIYRAWDGVAIAGPAAGGVSGGGIVSSGSFSALASLDLTVDSEGYITAKRPDISNTANGIPGEGRRLSFQDIRDSNTRMLEAASSFSGYELPFPPTVGGEYYLAELRPAYSVNLEHDPSAVLEAVYSSNPGGVTAMFEAVVMDAYRLSEFPEFALDSPVMVHEKIDLSAPDPAGEMSKLNRKSIDSLLHLEWFDNTGGMDRTTRIVSGDGYFGFLVGLQEIKPNEPAGGGAVVWLDPREGRFETLVTVRAASMGLDDLAELVKSLGG